MDLVIVFVAMFWWTAQFDGAALLCVVVKTLSHVARLSGGWIWERGGLCVGRMIADIHATVVFCFSVAVGVARSSTGNHLSVYGGSGYCSSTMDVSLGQTKLVDV